jgi:hypothetical protein
MATFNIDDALSLVKTIPDLPFFKEKLSETDTRSKLIDFMLIDVLGWSEANIVRKERCIENDTYLDYKISNLTYLISTKY